MKITIQGRNKSNGLQRLQCIQDTLWQLEERGHPGIGRRDGLQAWKKNQKHSIEQVTNITLWSSFLTLPFFCWPAAISQWALQLCGWSVAWNKLIHQMMHFYCCLHYCNSLIYSTIVHCTTWINKRATKSTLWAISQSYQRQKDIFTLGVHKRTCILY